MQNIYDIKIIRLCGGLKTSLSSLIIELTSEIYICTNNLYIAKEARFVSNRSSQVAFIRFKKIVKSWL